MSAAPVGLAAAVAAEALGVLVSVIVFLSMLRLLNARPSNGPQVIRPARVYVRLMLGFGLYWMSIALLFSPWMDSGNFWQYLRWWLILSVPFQAAMGLMVGVGTASAFVWATAAASRRPWKTSLLAHYKVAGLVSIALAALTFIFVTPALPWQLELRTFHGPGFSLSYPESWGVGQPRAAEERDGSLLLLEPPGAGEYDGISVSIDEQSGTIDEAEGGLNLLYQFLGRTEPEERDVEVPGAGAAADLSWRLPPSFFSPFPTRARALVAETPEGFVIVIAQAIETNYDGLEDDFDRVLRSLRVESTTSL